MTDKVTQSFVLTDDLIRKIRKWSKQEDRSLSAMLRQILHREAERRNKTTSGQKNS